MRLLCFHHAGGSSALFRGWSRALGPHTCVVPVVLPGREHRSGEPRPADLDALVAALDGELGEFMAEPHVLFGHSMGALVAYRLACRRRASLRALVVSAYPAPHLAAPLGTVDLRVLVGVGGLPPEVLEMPHDHLLAAVRDDLRMCADHRDRGEPTLACPVHVFGGGTDPLVSEDDLSAWQRHSAAPVEVQLLPGDHFYLREQPDRLLRLLRPLLQRYHAGAVS